MMLQQSMPMTLSFSMLPSFGECLPLNGVTPAGMGRGGQSDQAGPLIPGPGAKRDSTIFNLSNLSKIQGDQVQKARKFAMEQSVKTVLVKQTIAHQHQQVINFQSSVQRQQALALMCRVYVGSISFEVKEEFVRNSFSPFGPIRSLMMSYDNGMQKHKGFAFIEYDVPEAASLALEQMNMVHMGGRPIKVGRPSNMPAAQPIIAEILEEAKNFNRIYVSSVHPNLQDNDIRSVFEAFGKIKDCRLVPEPSKPTRHRGYGYIEYDTKLSAEDAVASMNLFDLGGQYLRVGRCVTPPNVLLPMPITPQTMPTASAVAAAAVTAKITALEVTGKTDEKDKKSPKRTTSPPRSQNEAPPLPETVPAPAPPPVPYSVNSIPTPPVDNFAVPSPPKVKKTSDFSSYMGTKYQDQMGLKAEPPQEKEPPLCQSLGIPVEDPNRESIESQEEMKIKGKDARHMVMQRLMRNTKCKVVVLRNMCGPEDVDNELEAEVTGECCRILDENRSGCVERVIIYQEKQGEEEGAEVIVNIFVEFNTQEAADTIINSLNGRYFGGRIVKAERYDVDLWESQDLSG